MSDIIEILKRRLEREKSIRQQVEKIAEDKSRELYLKNEELKQALAAEGLSRKKLEKLYLEVERLSHTDALTEVSNRRSFRVSAEPLLQLAIRHGKELSCAMLDIDFFKKVNDSYGHDCGDKVLISVAQTCKHQLRSSDLLARFGGEEFCFLFPETSIQNVHLKAEQIRSHIMKLKFDFGHEPLSITASLGVSTLRGATDTLDEILKRSDQALYQAKQQGRNRVVVWGSEMHGGCFNFGGNFH